MNPTIEPHTPNVRHKFHTLQLGPKSLQMSMLESEDADLWLYHLLKKCINRKTVYKWGDIGFAYYIKIE